MTSSAHHRFEFVDPSVGAAFDRDGYVVVALLESEDVARLGEVFGSLALSDAPTLSATLVGRRLDENRRISSEIESVVLPQVARFIRNAAVIGSTFLVKPTGDDGSMAVHQDWGSVDESGSHSINVWCPLVDVDSHNGTLEVVPGSHEWFETYRSPTLASVQLPFEEIPAGAVVPLRLAAGEAVIYDHRLLHGSRENRSGVARVVAQVGMSPAGQPLAMSRVVAPGSVALREVSTTAFFTGLDDEESGDDGGCYDGALVREWTPVTEEAFLRRLRNGADQPESAGTAGAASEPAVDERRMARAWRRVRSICSR